MPKRIGILLLAAIVGFLCFGTYDRFSSSGIGVISSADARVGRPMTPTSVSGVARRTVRRCAADIYDC